MAQSLPVDPFVALPLIAAGVVTAWAALLVYRRYESDDDLVYDDLARPYLVVVTVFAFGMLLSPAALLVVPEEALGVLPFVVFLSVVPIWFVLALRYAGRGHLVHRWWLVASYVVVLTLLVSTGLGAGGVVEEGDPGFSLLIAASALLVLVVLAMYFVAVGVIALSVYRSDDQSPVTVVVLVTPTVILLVIGQLTGQVDPSVSRLVTVVGVVVIAPVFVLSVTRYDVLSTRPGIRMLGERAVVHTMQAPVLVTDRSGQVVRANVTAREQFDDPVGASLTEVVGEDPEALSTADTVECWTTVGNRRFDPRVTTIESAGGQHVGETVTLIDVTDRVIRRQRIQVLNRILRHNLRNDLSAIKARAELATDQDRSAEEHVGTILDIADDLQAMSADARRIEKRIADADQQCVTVDTVVDAVVASVTEETDTCSVTVDVPAVTLSLDRSLLSYALRNLVENAIEHNDSDDPTVRIEGRETATGVEIVVADDGPGIPDGDREAIEAGMEDAHTHTTSLGLWGTNWAVQTLGGTLAFGESELGGAAVTVELPTDEQ